MELIKKYQDLIIKDLKNIYTDYTPLVKSLYTPAEYALEGGKKLRPVLVLMAAEAFGQRPEKVLPAALAIEMFHNFTLVHDDVMDHSPIRRGRETVYKKWSVNQAILTGDAMLLLSFRFLHLFEPDLARSLLERLSWVGLRVSEGQQLDMEFETRNNISEAEYLQMIELKTAVLIGVALQMGAITAKASDQDQQQIYQFGKNIGLAFQIQDDYMDLYADEEKFGKRIGNDIVTNKKTYLLIKALERADGNDRQTLLHLFSTTDIPEQEKIARVREIYARIGIQQYVKEEIEQMYLQAKDNLNNISGLTEQWKENFSAFADWLMKRQK